MSKNGPGKGGIFLDPKRKRLLQGGTCTWRRRSWGRRRGDCRAGEISSAAPVQMIFNEILPAGPKFFCADGFFVQCRRKDAQAMKNVFVLMADMVVMTWKFVSGFGVLFDLGLEKEATEKEKNSIECCSYSFGGGARTWQSVRSGWMNKDRSGRCIVTLEKSMRALATCVLGSLTTKRTGTGFGPDRWK